MGYGEFKKGTKKWKVFVPNMITFQEKNRILKNGQAWTKCSQQNLTRLMAVIASKIEVMI